MEYSKEPYIMTLSATILVELSVSPVRMKLNGVFHTLEKVVLIPMSSSPCPNSKTVALDRIKRINNSGRMTRFIKRDEASTHI